MPVIFFRLNVFPPFLFIGCCKVFTKVFCITRSKCSNNLIHVTVYFWKFCLVNLREFQKSFHLFFLSVWSNFNIRHWFPCHCLFVTLLLRLILFFFFHFSRLFPHISNMFCSEFSKRKFFFDFFFLCPYFFKVITINFTVFIQVDFLLFCSQFFCLCFCKVRISFSFKNLE